jgi:hypothetical protein
MAMRIKPRPQYVSPTKQEKKPRKRIKRVSKKQAVINALAAPTRKQFLEDWPVCMMCESAASQHVHEITRGHGRQHALCEPLLCMAVCAWCHDEELSDAANWPIVRQLNRRLRWEANRMCRLANVARGRGPKAIEAKEIL